MASTEERVRQLVDSHLSIEGRKSGAALDLNAAFADVGISSMAAVAFMREVAGEFNVQMAAGDCARFANLQQLIDFLDGNAG